MPKNSKSPIIPVNSSPSSMEARHGGQADFVDRFEVDVERGKVVGSTLNDNVKRKGVDKEGVISIDHGALRIEPLVRPGWGRSGISYGPYERRNGLTFCVLVLNGHNISRSEPLPEGFRMRLKRWLAGSEHEGALRRASQWVKHGNKRHMWRRLRQWAQSGSGLLHWPFHEENLAVGWFPLDAPDRPKHQGAGFIVHAIVQDGGELWTRQGPAFCPVVRGVQNIPMLYAVILREQGAAYYICSWLEGVPGMVSPPKLQPVAIDAFTSEERLYAGVHQCVLGEIGFRVDTRVYGTQVVQIPQFGSWFGTANGADTLVGEGPLEMAEIGGGWQVVEGEFRKTRRGVEGLAECNTAMLRLDSPTGLVHMLIDCRAEPVAGVGAVWRAVDEKNYWCFEVGSNYGQLVFVEGERAFRHPPIQGRCLAPNTLNSLQILDDGERIRISLNGSVIYGGDLSDTRLERGAGVGIRMAPAGSGVVIRSFEAHPRAISMPLIKEIEGPRLRRATDVIMADTYDGPPGDLDGHCTTLGNLRWRRQIGRGEIELTGRGAAKVRASAAQPCPGRTAYVVDWPNPEFADVEVTITPAGLCKGTKEKGRAGLIFWQDAENYLILSAFVEDWPAMSIAAFFQIAGFDEIFDAVWSNVGTRLHWGEPHNFRVVFDRQHFVAYINGEPVLYRAIFDVYPHSKGLTLGAVGIVSNWEWGNDTGSKFENFVGRDRR